MPPTSDKHSLPIKDYGAAEHPPKADIAFPAFPSDLDCEFCAAAQPHEHWVTCGAKDLSKKSAPLCAFCERRMTPERLTWTTRGTLFAFNARDVPGYECHTCSEGGTHFPPETMGALFSVAAAHYRRGGQSADAAEKRLWSEGWKIEADRQHRQPLKVSEGANLLDIDNAAA